MIRKMIAAAVLGILVTASSAMAQEGRWQEISVQGTGFFTEGFEREWDQPARHGYGWISPKLSLSLQSLAGRRRELRLRPEHATELHFLRPDRSAS